MNEAPRYNDLAGRLREADAVTPELVADVIREACWRLPSVRRTKKFDSFERLIQSGAWTECWPCSNWNCRNGSFGASFMMTAIGIAPCRASARFRTGWISPSKPATLTSRSRYFWPLSRRGVSAPSRQESARRSFLVRTGQPACGSPATTLRNWPSAWFNLQTPN